MMIVATGEDVDRAGVGLGFMCVFTVLRHSPGAIPRSHVLRKRGMLSVITSVRPDKIGRSYPSSTRWGARWV